MQGRPARAPAIDQPAMAENNYRDPSRAKKHLDGIASILENEALASAIDSASRSSPDPDTALLAFLRFAETLKDYPEANLVVSRLSDSLGLKILAALFGGSDYLSQIIIRYPKSISDLFDSPFLHREKPGETLACELESRCGGIGDREKMTQELRRYRNSEMLRITARDLMGFGGIEELMAEISCLASAAADSAYRFCRNELARAWGEPFEEEEGGARHPARFTVLGMGKLGGRELNYSSDIDLIYIYGSDNGGFEASSKGAAPSGKSLADFWARVGENMSQLIGEVTEDGLVFRVDLRLRPGGSSGAEATSLDAAVDYYLTWGQTWERAALLKARPVAGDIKLGEEFLYEIEPWLHRRYLDFGLLDEIREMKSRFEIEARRAGSGSWDVKLGSGGIREIEFFVQSLELVHGGKMPSIRRRNTLNTLKALREEGLISERDAEDLSRSYRFLRKLEHCIQIQEFQQTQRLPRLPEDRDRLAALMGFRGPHDKRWAEFEERLSEYRADVEERYRGLFVTPREDAKQAVVEEAALLARGEIPAEEGQKWLADRGFADPANAYRSLERLREGPRRLAYLSDGTRKRWEDIAPLVIQEVASAPDPDMALTNLERFLAGVGARATTLALLRQHPGAVRFLVNLFGTSEYLSDFFISRPELLDGLVGPRREAPGFDSGAMRNEVSDAISSATDLEERLDALRLFVHERMLKIGLDDLAGDADHRVTSGRLSTLAEVSLGAAYEISRIEIETRLGEPVFKTEGQEVRGGLVVLGMGKLGGAELSYGSDLDVIFVYTPGVAESLKGATSHEYFVKLAQRIISAITIETAQGHCYSLDTRLRPSGRAGSLVTSLESFERYHRESGAAWERQALIRMRPVAGDFELGRRTLDAIYPFVYERPLTDTNIEEIRHVRRRMAEERSRSAENRLDIKLEPGGLVDAEFVTQVMQLRFGRDKKELQTPHTAEALEAIRGLMDEDDRKTLMAGWDFLRKVGLRLRITRALDSPIIEIKSRRALIVARALGYDESRGDPGEMLLADVRAYMQKIKALYDKYV